MSKIIVNPKYEYLRSWIESIPSRFESEGNTIYHLRNLIKVFGAPDGLNINVKRYHKPAFINKLVYTFGLREPKGMRAYRNPEYLLSCGIDTPDPVAYIEEFQGGLLAYSYFLSIQCDYPHTMYDVGNAPVGTYEDIAVALAGFAADMHEKGIMHKDFTPGNVLWTKENGEFKFSIIDTNRMYFGPVSFDIGLRNIIKFWGPKEFARILFSTYATLRGANAVSAENKALAWRRQFWIKYRKKHIIPFRLEI